MITEEMLIIAAGEVNEALLKSLPEDVCRYAKSPRFERKMQRVIRKGNHPVLYRTIQRAACYVLVFFLSFMTVIAFSPTARAAVVDWIRERFSYFDQYSYIGKSAYNREKVQYELTYIPEGYTEFSRIEKTPNTTIRYLDNNTNQLISFSYSQDKQRVIYNFESNGYIFRNVSVGMLDANFYKAHSKDTPNTLVWMSEDNSTLFFISSFLPEAEIIKIAENVKTFS